MKQRNLFIFAGVFGALLVYVIMTQTGGFNTVHLPQLKPVAADQMEKIEIRLPEGEVAFAKKSGTWQIAKPIVFPADTNKLDELVRTLAELRLTDMITERPEAVADYGLNSGTAVGVKVFGSKGQSLDLNFGHVNQANTHTFVQMPGRRTVYQVLGDVSEKLRRPAAEWRSLKIFDFSPDGVRSVTLAKNLQKPLTFVKVEEVQKQIVNETPKGVTPAPLPSKTVWKAEGVPAPLNDPKVNQWLNGFTRLSASHISDRPEWTAAPQHVIRVKTVNQEYVLEFLVFEQGPNRYLVRRGGEQLLFEIDKYTGDNLLKEAKDLI